MNTEFIGEFVVQSGQIALTPPENKVAEIPITIKGCAQGLWVVEIDRDEEDDEIAVLCAFHKKMAQEDKDDNWEGIDSLIELKTRLVGIFESRKYSGFSQKELMEIKKSTIEKDLSSVPHIVIDKMIEEGKAPPEGQTVPTGGMIETYGVVVSAPESGGTYPVDVLLSHDNKIIGIQITFRFPEFIFEDEDIIIGEVANATV